MRLSFSDVALIRVSLQQLSEMIAGEYRNVELVRPIPTTIPRG